VAGSLVLSAVAIAPAQQPTPAPTPIPTSGIHARRFGHPGRGNKQYDRALLRGITLSDAEKANLQSVHAKYASQTQALRTQMRTESANIRAARQRGDTAALRSLRATEISQRQSLMQTEQNDLRNALSPANQAKFDSNVQSMQARAAKRSFHPRKSGK
jgi:Spy/CpxP family protein refolding chaperone